MLVLLDCGRRCLGPVHGHILSQRYFHAFVHQPVYVLRRLLIDLDAVRLVVPLDRVDHLFLLAAQFPFDRFVVATTVYSCFVGRVNAADHSAQAVRHKFRFGRRDVVQPRGRRITAGTAAAVTLGRYDLGVQILYGFLEATCPENVAITITVSPAAAITVSTQDSDRRQNDHHRH